MGFLGGIGVGEKEVCEALKLIENPANAAKDLVSLEGALCTIIKLIHPKLMDQKEVKKIEKEQNLIQKMFELLQFEKELSIKTILAAQTIIANITSLLIGFYIGDAESKRQLGVAFELLNHENASVSLQVPLCALYFVMGTLLQGFLLFFLGLFVIRFQREELADHWKLHF